MSTRDDLARTIAEGFLGVKRARELWAQGYGKGARDNYLRAADAMLAAADSVELHEVWQGDYLYLVTGDLAAARNALLDEPEGALVMRRRRWVPVSEPDDSGREDE